ncbi:Cytochrome P450 oxidoreductase [Fusarium keratoplasticum]|nr:Cytochrome P450 oxidoreductase [Fusarium keratoplasticum]
MAPPQLLEFALASWHLILPSILILYLVSNRYQGGLYKVPGPWLNSVSTLPRMWSVYKGQHHLDDLRLHAKYGKYVRLAPNLVSISDPGQINQIYGINTSFFKSPFYELSAVYDEQGLVPDPFVIQNNKSLHSRMKRNAANAYSMNGLLKFEPWVDDVMERLLVKLDNHADVETSCDLGDMMKNFAMDAVCRLTFGRDLNYLDKGDQHGFFRLLDLFTPYMAIFGHVAWLHPYLLGNPWIVGSFTKGETSTQAMISLSQNELERSHKDSMSENSAMTFLGRLSLNKAAKPDQINDREIVTHAFGNISAGSDTTAIAMRSVMYNILNDRKAYNRLTSDVRKNLSLPVSFSSANELPYLRAAIQEGMRLHPSVGQILSRSAPEGGALVGDYKLKANVQVGMSPWVLHRDPDVFPEPDCFKPERWIIEEGHSDEDALRRMNRSFFAFGHGTHTCSGKHISIMETTKLVATLLLKYDLELAEGVGPLTFVNRWFTQQEGLIVNVRHRK